VSRPARVALSVVSGLLTVALALPPLLMLPPGVVAFALLWVAGMALAWRLSRGRRRAAAGLAAPAGDPAGPAFDRFR